VSRARETLPAASAALDAALLRRVVALKHLDRAGWKRVGIVHPESVAAHSFGVAFAALLRRSSEHDLGKVLAMALLHDVAEVVVGDLTPFDGVPPDEKHARERQAFESLLAHRPDLLALVDELEAGESPEAKLVRGLDKVDMDVTAESYADAGYDTTEFRRSARDAADAVWPERASGGRGSP
jgi:putative hydrolases of HD superfamily